MEELKPGDRLRVAEAGDKAYQEFLAKNPDVQASPVLFSAWRKFSTVLTKRA